MSFSINVSGIKDAVVKELTEARDVIDNALQRLGISKSDADDTVNVTVSGCVSTSADGKVTSVITGHTVSIAKKVTAESAASPSPEAPAAPAENAS
jgi:hypothetical protein